MTTHRRTRRKAFTLLEILVTISIISLLIGILLPSLRRVRQSAADLQCLSRVRSLYLAHVEYIHNYLYFPPLNNDEDDGAWQYNYLIYDGRDYDQNFGALVNAGIIDDVTILFCPVQDDPYHSLNTPLNSWPARDNLDVRAGYARRYHLSGMTLAQAGNSRAMLADIFHLTSVIETAHKRGVNVMYTDGHGRWVNAPKIMLDNELGHPFDPLDNSIVRKIWKKLDGAK